MGVCKPKPLSGQANFAVQAKVALARRRLTVKQLAADLGLSRNAVSRAINQPADLPTVKQRVKEALKL